MNIFIVIKTLPTYFPHESYHLVPFRASSQALIDTAFGSSEHFQIKYFICSESPWKVSRAGFALPLL